MTEPQPPPTVRPAEDPPPVVRNLGLKATLLLLLMFLLLLGSGAYLLYARGVFEASQRLILITDDSEGVAVGMNMTFAGFAIGRVGRIDLGDDGNARILIDVPRKDARWLRTSSVFTIERGLVGGTNIRAHTGMLEDPPLADGAERHALRGDASDFLPGDVVSWRLDNGLPHVGLVLRQRSADGARPLVIHNIGAGTQVEDVLLQWKINGHFRYFPVPTSTPAH